MDAGADFSPLLVGRKARQYVHQRHGNTAVLVLQAIADRTDFRPASREHLECRRFGVAGLAALLKAKPDTIKRAVDALVGDGFVTVVNREQTGAVQVWKLNPTRIAGAVAQINAQPTRQRAKLAPLPADMAAVLGRFQALGGTVNEAQQTTATRLLASFSRDAVLTAIDDVVGQGRPLASLAYLELPLRQKRRQARRAPAVPASDDIDW
jgi:hypothetical protein